MTPTLGGAGPVPTASAPARSTAHDTLPLRLTRAFPPEGQRHPETIVGSGLSGKLAGAWLRDAALGLLAMLAALTLLNSLAGWMIALRRRAERPLQPAVMTHANWPVISILIPPRGNARARIERVRELAEADFDYPAERIHFVIAHPENDDMLIHAIEELRKQREGRVHPLPCPPAGEQGLSGLVESAMTCSAGDALVLLDQDLPVPADWLRSAVSPLLDPATAIVVARCVGIAPEAGAAARLEMLSAQADARIVTQSDALARLLAGKARIRALRRQALRTTRLKGRALSEERIALELAGQGWQAALLDGLSYRKDAIGQGLRFGTAIRCLGLISGFLKPRFPAMARRQIRAALGTALAMLGWQAMFLCGIVLYFLGEPLAAGVAVMLCAFTAFDSHGVPDSALRAAILPPEGAQREDACLLALMPMCYLARQVQGLLPVRQLTPRDQALEPDTPSTLPAESF
ncbi:glycosyltransferase family 2 protein [Uliginosibacterium paludis]|uniref:Glycosyltransferase family 2 protein n=1 Tax=Uliginosibacterium paludis TaxID=1615952 RepID=A0ABV2CPW3_9RHOO